MFSRLPANRLLAGALLLAIAGMLLLPARSSGHGINLGSVAKIFETADRRKAEALSQLEKNREAVGQKSPAARQTACVNHRGRLSDSKDNLYKQVTEQTYAVDAIFEGVHVFYDNFEPETSQLAAALKTAENAYLSAQVEAGALSLLNVDVDCEDSDVAADVAAFSTTVKASQKALEDYKRAVLDLTAAMRTELEQTTGDAN